MVNNYYIDITAKGIIHLSIIAYFRRLTLLGVYVVERDLVAIRIPTVAVLQGIQHVVRICIPGFSQEISYENDVRGSLNGDGELALHGG